MSITVRVVVLAAIGIASALGQSSIHAAASTAPAFPSAVSLPGVTAPPHPSWLTDKMVFEFLFKHVASAESRADQLKSMGKDDSSQRHLFKKVAKLTDQEEALLKSVAADHETTMSTFRASAAVTATGIRTQYPTKAQMPPSASQQLQALNTQKAQITQSHMARLQSGMSAGEFQRLYNFAWGTEGPRIHLGQPTAAPAGLKSPVAKQKGN